MATAGRGQWLSLESIICAGSTFTYRSHQMVLWEKHKAMQEWIDGKQDTGGAIDTGYLGPLLMFTVADIHALCWAPQLRERILSTTWPTSSLSSGLSTIVPLLSPCCLFAPLATYPIRAWSIISHFPTTFFLLFVVYPSTYPVLTYTVILSWRCISEILQDVFLRYLYFFDFWA